MMLTQRNLYFIQHQFAGIPSYCQNFPQILRKKVRKMPSKYGMMNTRLEDSVL